MRRKKQSIGLQFLLPLQEYIVVIPHRNKKHQSLAQMALPLPPVLSPAECAQFGRSFARDVFSSQLARLPAHLVEAGITKPDSLDNLREIYVSTNPFVTVLAFALVLCPVFVLVSEITRNYSQVDRVWSILPVVYNAHYAIWARLSGLPTSRLDSVALFTLFWGVGLFSQPGSIISVPLTLDRPG